VETVSTREVYANPWMTVREDRVRRADGSVGLYGVVDKPDFALVVPREDDGSLWLVEQYRYPVRRRAWEFPQGSWGAGAAGDREQLAAAELREETGLTAARLRHLARLHGAYGFSSQGCDVYLATGLTPGTPQREATEQDMRHRRVPREELVAMVADGAVVDAATLAAYALLLLDEAR
jgi:8-oxo-dGTP pyrophosphatase MutT (NUDIX family)